MSTGKSIDILIVDDNPNNRLSLQSLFKEYFDNVRTFETDSGLTALTFLIKQLVDLIILDIQMPHMDGFETAKIIQSRAKTRHIPIVFLTAAYKSEEFQKKGYELGAVDYLTKPIDTADFVQKIRAYLRIIQQGQQRNDESRLETEQSETNQGAVDLKEIENLLREVRLSFNAIIDYSKVLEDKVISLGCNDCVADIKKIDKDSKQLLDFIENVLKPKINRR
jgi:CheY-like chemotaxis protein